MNTHQTWTDDFLQWTPANFGGIDHIVLPALKVWTPDLGLDNGVSYFTTSDWVSDFRVSVRYNGEVLWTFGGEFTTSCTLHVTTYPFDKVSYKNYEIYKFKNFQFSTANM